MESQFFEKPILNSPYHYPVRHWELDDTGQPTQKIGEFCRVAEAHPKVSAYVKNHGLGLEVPYRYASETRKYIPDFIVQVDDGQGRPNVAGAMDGGSDRGHGQDDPLNLIVEIKGYRREDAKEKKSTMDTYWVPGVNHLGNHGRWAFAEFTDVYAMQDDFAKRVEAEFDKMIDSVTDRVERDDTP